MGRIVMFLIGMGALSWAAYAYLTGRQSAAARSPTTGTAAVLTSTSQRPSRPPNQATSRSTLAASVMSQAKNLIWASVA